jgi:predicted transposase YbfD/YdcC
MQSPETTLVAYFDDIEDVRLDRNKKHLLVDILVLAICGVICGANGPTEIVSVAKGKLAWFRTFLRLPNGIPSHDTIGRVLGMIRPDILEARFLAWVRASFPTIPIQQIAIDGKVSRRSVDATNDLPALRMISAWAVESGIVVGQMAVDHQSNEITALPLLLETLAIEGCDITADAMHCQKETIAAIINQKAQYTIAVKANQGHLYDDIGATFTYLREHAASSLQTYTTCEKGHGRIETRRYWVTDQLDRLRTANTWAQLHTIGMVESERRVNGKIEQETRYYISSRETHAQSFGERVRRHWSIENSLHWVLDVAMREDEARVRKDHCATNMAVIRHIAMNLLKQEKTQKVGVQAKRLLAACNTEYLCTVLQLGRDNTQNGS